MKKLPAQITLLALASMLLPSCSKQLNTLLTKRHYRSGYYVDWAGKKPGAATGRIVASIKTEPKIALIGVAKTESGLNIRSAVLIPEKLSKPQKSLSPRYINPIADKPSTPTVWNQNENTSNISGVNSITAVSDVRIDINVSFVVVVICAIFIPPLGVALMYGIHLYFWVDLVLTLLFFIPGMIFALIVVLM
jgi:uncharacterized membrane protein YqaE (UPF0057 family)